MGHLRGGYLAEHHSQRGPVISKGLPPNFSLQMLAKGQQPTGSIRACRDNDRSSVVGNSRPRYLNLVAGQAYHSGFPQASEETRAQVKPRRFVSAVAHKRLGPRRVQDLEKMPVRHISQSQWSRTGGGRGRRLVTPTLFKPPLLRQLRRIRSCTNIGLTSEKQTTYTTETC
jgi:hypothetical protein